MNNFGATIRTTTSTRTRTTPQIRNLGLIQVFGSIIGRFSDCKRRFRCNVQRSKPLSATRLDSIVYRLTDKSCPQPEALLMARKRDQNMKREPRITLPIKKPTKVDKLEPQWRFWIWYFLLTLLFLWGWQELANQVQFRTIPYSQFKTYLTQHEVTEAVVKQDEIDGSIVPRRRSTKRKISRPRMLPRLLTRRPRSSP